MKTKFSNIVHFILTGRVKIVMNHMFGRITQEIVGEARQVDKYILAFN